MKELRLKNGSVIQFGKPRGEKYQGRGYLWFELDGEIEGPFATGDTDASITAAVPGDNQLYRMLHDPDRGPVR